METVFAALAGLAWGALCGFANVLILKKAIAKNDSNILMAANLGRMTVDLLALLAVFLLRTLLPFPYEAVLVGTALALSAVPLFFAFRYGKR